MAEKFISRGFKGRSTETGGAPRERVPPGQYATKEFPVLSAGPTPRTPLGRWDFSVYGEIAEDLRWTWDEFLKLPRETFKVDIHCVTKWSKLDTVWTGVSIDTLLEGVNLEARPEVRHLIAFCDGGYTTNLPLADVRNGKAWVVYEYDGKPLAPEHGGPARLLVPHLYFWKSAKWVRGLKLVSEDRPGFWETAGYHNYGDPWKEQRYAGD
jgi:DMSO/TMAO reductase YedYZ molybdopterin-dependent catalytic subunit